MGEIMKYVHLTNNIIDIAPRLLSGSWRHVSNIDRRTPTELKALGWLPVVYVNEAYDPASQIRTGPTGCNIGDAVPAGADDVTGTYTVRAKTQQELDDDQRNQDLAALRDAVVDMAIVQTEFIDWTLANTAMQATDFEPDTKQRYLDIKAIADRVK